MNEISSAHELLLGMGNFLTGGEYAFDHEKIMKFFYTRREKNPLLLQNIAFDEDGIYPRSGAIDEAMDSLAEARILTSWTNRPGIYHFGKACKRSYERSIRKKISGKVASELESIAKEFRSEFGVK
jgi:hypothetical protein